MATIEHTTIMEAPLFNRERLSEDMGNLLVLAPHPDDESLGCGGLIALLIEAGSKVSVIFVTSGSASHTSETFPPNILSKIRESEAVRACSDLGVFLPDLHFLRAPDSKLSGLDENGISALVDEISRILENGEFTSVAIPWRRDPHPDHMVVNRVGETVLEKIDGNITKLEYPIWLWKNGTRADWPMDGEVVPYRLNIAPVAAKKWHAVQRHSTQLGRIIHDDPNGFVLTDDLLEPFISDFEHYFVTRRELTTLDAGYFDTLYSQQADPWNFRGSEYEHEKYRGNVQALGGGPFTNALELGCSIGIQSGMLSEICGHLIAVDISDVAISEAEKNCSDKYNIQFRQMDITKDFPEGRFDLITCCEVGYYLTVRDLGKLFVRISGALKNGGRLMLVHWTPFVPDYPISGDQVHDIFSDFADTTGDFKIVLRDRKDRYRTDIWERASGESAT